MLRRSKNCWGENREVAHRFIGHLANFTRWWHMQKVKKKNLDFQKLSKISLDLPKWVIRGRFPRLHTSRALFISSSECSVLLLCSVRWRDKSLSHEKELDSISNTEALASLSHRFVSVDCSGAGRFIDWLTSSSALNGNQVLNYHAIFEWKG